MLVERFPENPLITPKDVKPSRSDYQVVGAFNAGTAIYNDEIILLLRVAERPVDKKDDEELAPIYNHATGQIDCLRIKLDDPDLEPLDSRVFHYKKKLYLTSISHLRIARSKDGVNFIVDEKPTILPEKDYENFGLEDPRISKIGDTYYICYKVVSDKGVCTGLMTTSDFKSFERKGIIFCPENIDVVMFPEKIDGMFYALTRPVPMLIGPRGVWTASSPDTINWGRHKPLILPREGMFDGGKTGGSCVPIKTEDGWLEIYHGSDENDKYSLAAALLDLKDPSKVIARSKEPLMYPQANYEVKGFYGNVVFSCGAITKDNGEVIIYYGASDELTAAAKTTIDKIMSTLK
ncbi:MAG: glycoside hydrolase family 130 protein [Sedimentisphaerales bacterium]|nr:glycoside hydrolase family 130 protein [Sedimentisphaerales bacterium]